MAVNMRELLGMGPRTRPQNSDDKYESQDVLSQALEYLSKDDVHGFKAHLKSKSKRVTDWNAPVLDKLNTKVSKYCTYVCDVSVYTHIVHCAIMRLGLGVRVYVCIL